MRNEGQRWYGVELIFYTLLASFIVGSIYYLFYYSPVNYTLLISEDNIAEYLTAVCFGLVGIILLTLSFKRGPKVRKVSWGLIGLIALLIAAEELSWGQRIFYFDTPGVLNEINLQREVSLHNIAIFDDAHQKLHVTLSYLILLYIVFSLVVQMSMPRLEEKFVFVGVPLIRLRLVPIFLLAPYFLISYPFTRSDEIGELFLGIAALIWAVDLFHLSASNKQFDRSSSVFKVAGVLTLAVLMSGALAYRSSSDSFAQYSRGSLLNLMALRDYTTRGMYEQAHSVYSYIYQHPQYMTEDTRINHARMLQTMGKKAEADEILYTAARELEENKHQKALNSMQLRSLGIVYLLLMKNAVADDYFDRSIELDQKALSLNATPDDQAKILLSISQTMQARGDVEIAIVKLERALEVVNSPFLHHKIKKQLEKLMSL